jgi:hypothetical protein
MLSLNTSIVRHDIEAIGRLSTNHPVFLLVGKHEEELALKMQASCSLSASRMQRNFEIMAIVSPHSKQVALNINEVHQLRVWVGAELIQASDQQKRLLLADFHNELQRPTQGNAWIKMEVKKIDTLADAVGNKEADRNKVKIKAFSKALAAPGGLEALGEIVAADLFNNNGDRFNYPLDQATGKLQQAGCGDIYGNTRLTHLYNLGNVMVEFDKKGKHGKLLGLDSFDTNADHTKWKTPLATSERSSSTRWSGRLLAVTSKTDREYFARCVIADLEFVLGKRHRKIPFASKLRLGKDANQRFYNGMESGITKILREIRQYYGVLGRVIPQGMTDRLQLLGR